MFISFLIVGLISVLIQELTSLPIFGPYRWKDQGIFDYLNQPDFYKINSIWTTKEDGFISHLPATLLCGYYVKMPNGKKFMILRFSPLHKKIKQIILNASIKRYP
jgi:hypothetical protein